jgi:hypothetical protein
MYLARLRDNDGSLRYIIRQSYRQGGNYHSRDLYEIGEDPSRFIVLPGGNAFYIDTELEEKIAAQGVEVSQDDLEDVFKPFLPPHILRVIDGFDRKDRHGAPSQTCMPADHFHVFDRYRLHFLKLGRAVLQDGGCIPEGFYRILAHKSRDEIEYDFMDAERHLNTEELSHYVYQIFDLQRFFVEHHARSHPEGLSRDRLDRFFMQALCDLNIDNSFWMGAAAPGCLQPHLARYAVMYFDNAFPLRNPHDEFLRDFMNRHRGHRPPESVRISLDESARLFGVTVDNLKKMDCRTLTRHYRKLAQIHHPDKGGDQERFVKLSTAYRKLLKRKSNFPVKRS